MSCYTGSYGAVAFCINTDEREELPIIEDPLQVASRKFEFDLLGRSVNVNQALQLVGQTQLTLKIFSFIDDNSIVIGFLLPLTVPLIHYGMKLLALLHRYFFFFTDLHRILLGPFWRAVFRLPKDASLHPSYSLYVYCCDLLCISSPEPEEFFHPSNYTDFVRIAWLINPLKFTIVNEDMLREHAEIARTKAEAEEVGQELPEG